MSAPVFDYATDAKFLDTDHPIANYGDLIQVLISVIMSSGCFDRDMR